MTVDIELYSLNKDFCIRWFKEKGHGDIKRCIGMLASMTFVPCIVVAYWLGEATDWHPDAVSSIKNLIDFYGYTNILNKPPGAPI